jgi:hypothetical protein
MKDFVSSGRVSALALVAAVSLVWVACSILAPLRFPWTGLWWMALVLFASYRTGTLAVPRTVAVMVPKEVPWMNGDRS